METLDRATAASWAAAVVKRADVLYLDTETTGLGDDAEIVDIAVIDSSGHVVLNTLVRPSGRISQGASDVHGIDDRMVANAPAWPGVYPMLAKLLRDRPTVVIYNAAFDTRIINQVNRRHRLPELIADWACAMLQYGAFDGEWNPRYGNYRWHKLGVAARKVGVPMPSAHRALADTEACRGVVHAMAATARVIEAPSIEVPKPKPTSAKRQWTPLPEIAHDLASAFHVHDRVFHHQLGYGRVMKVLVLDGDHEVTVEFAGNGEKRLLASLAKLERVSDEGAVPTVPQADTSPTEVSKPKPVVAKLQSSPKPTNSTLQLTSSPYGAPSISPAFQGGDRVFHHKFGYGWVTKVSALGGDHEVTVEFAWRGEKRLLASLAKLERLSDWSDSPAPPRHDPVSRVDRSMLTPQPPPQSKPLHIPAEDVPTRKNEEHTPTSVPAEGGTGLPDWVKIVAGIVAIVWILGQVC